MALYGVGLDNTVKRIQLEIKLYISKKGGITVRNLKKIFKESDKNGNKKLEPFEFEKALNSFGFFLKKVDLQALIKQYDKDKDGCIDFEEFVNGIREPLNQRRLKIVNKVFDLFDREKTNVAYLSDILESYDVSKHPLYISGKKTKEELKIEFLSNFELTGGRDQIIRDEFLAYYEDLSLGISSDQQLVETLQNTWGIVEDEESDVAIYEVQNILKTLRFKLIQKTNGNHEEFIMRKLFAEFDINKSGYLSLEELYAMLIKLDIPIQRYYLVS